MENRFKSGDVVYSKNAPRIKLIVRRCIDDVYYCKVHASAYSPEKTFYERELMESTNPADKRTD
ncbi:MAG: hypothetical protein RIA62_04150 [Cyclobacteriaceae bacterium]